MAHVASATSFDVFGPYVPPQRFNLESFKRPLSWISRVSRLQLSIVHHHWSVYPYFKSGLLAVSSIEEGLFLVKRAESSRRLRGARV